MLRFVSLLLAAILVAVLAWFLARDERSRVAALAGAGHGDAPAPEEPRLAAATEPASTRHAARPGAARLDQKSVPLAPRDSRAALLRGHVRGPETDRVRASAFVELVTFGNPKDSADGAPPWTIFQEGHRVQYTRSDEDGAFEFEEVEPGTHAVRASHGALLRGESSWFTLGVFERKEDLVVRLPGGGKVVGKILKPESASFEGLRVELERLDPPSMPFDVVGSTVVQSLNEALRMDGTFEFGPVESGRCSIRLVSSDVRPGAGAMDPTFTPKVHLGDVVVPSGSDIEVTYDLTRSFLASLSIAIELHGALASRLRVFARPLAETPEALVLVTKLRNGRWWADSIPCGHWRIVVVHESFPPWRYELLEPVNVQAGETREVTIDVPLARGQVVIVDAATRQPCPEEFVALLAHAPFGTSNGFVDYRFRHTSADGILDFLLPPGEYRLIRVADNFSDVALEGACNFAWTVSGPRDPVLALSAAAISPREITDEPR